MVKCNAKPVPLLLNKMNDEQTEAKISARNVCKYMCHQIKGDIFRTGLSAANRPKPVAATKWAWTKKIKKNKVEKERKKQ